MEIGPLLPPHLRNNRDSSDSDQSDHETTFGPVLPKRLVENREKNLEKTSKGYNEIEPEKRKKSQNIAFEEISVGPRLPSHLQKRLCSDKKGENDSDHEDSEEDDCYGPALPPGYNRNRKEEKILCTGPVLPQRVAQYTGQLFIQTICIDVHLFRQASCFVG